MVDFAVLAEKKNKYLDLAKELKKLGNMKMTTIPRIGKGTGGLGNNRTSEDYQNYCITEISQNNEKNPGDKETCCCSNSSKRPSANADVKNSQRRRRRRSKNFKRETESFLILRKMKDASNS